MFQEALFEGVTRARSETEPELFDGLLRHSTVGELRARPAANRSGELLPEIGERNFVRLQQPFPQRRIAAAVVAVLARIRLGKCEADFLRQHPHGVLEPELLVELQELEHVAADAASEAVEEPLLRIHGERGRFLVVKRTVALVRRARTLQGYVFLHHLEDVGLQLQVVKELLGK